MPLISLWKADPKSIAQLKIDQLVATAGDGLLKDQSACAEELREYFSEVTSPELGSYAAHCLESSFNRSGQVLQDIVNELGRRLDYDVTNGLYQGTASSLGFDGIWKSPEGHATVVEVKTTDTYRIPLDKIAHYRTELLKQGAIAAPSSILIVVGRDDTGELEAQVRGSRHAWDIRLISVDALLKLVAIKESTGSAETAKQIRSLLVPFEYTKLDNIIEAMFTATADVEAAVGEERAEPPDIPPGSQSLAHHKTFQFTDTAELDAKRTSILDAMGAVNGIRLVKKSRAVYWSAAHDFRVVCTVSKRYEGTLRTGMPTTQNGINSWEKDSVHFCCSDVWIYRSPLRSRYRNCVRTSMLLT
jgi:hypothetical protein